MDWKAIRQEYESTEITLKELATKHAISEGTMRSRKNREKWQRNATPEATQRATEKSVATPEIIESAKTPSENAVLDSGLTPMQMLFVREYLVDLNATQAAIRAGYSAKTASEQGSRLLANVKIRQLIEQAMAERAQRTEITADMVLREFAKLGFSNMKDFTEWGPRGVKLKPSEELPDELAACVSEVSESFTEAGRTLKFKLHDKKGALEAIAKHLGMFVERKEVTGKDGGPIELTAMTAEQRQKRIQELLAKRGVSADGEQSE